MSDSPFDVFEPYVPSQPRPTSEAPEPSWLDEVGANFRVGQDDYVAGINNQRRVDAYQPIIDALVDLNGTNLRRYFNVDTRGIGDPVNYGAIWGDIAAARARDPNAFKGIAATREEFEAGLIAQTRDRRTRDQQTIAAGGSVTAALVGGAGAVFTDPLNLLTLPIGGGGKTVLQVAGRVALLNGLLELAQQPGVANNRRIMGEELTMAEAGANVGIAALGGGIFGGLIAGATRGGAKLLEKATPLDRKLAAALAAADVDDVAMLDLAVSRGLFDDMPDADLAELLRAVKGEEALTPTERAAITAIERQVEIDAANPYVSTGAADDVHADSLLAALDAALRDAEPIMPRPAMVTPRADAAALPDVRQASTDIGAARIGDFDLATYKSKNRVAESGGNDRAKADGSSATGRYQFVKGTFETYWKKVFGGSDADAARAWNTRRFDGQVQEALMDRFTADNVSFLRRIGAPLTNGNVYLTHFLGPGGAGKLLRASPDTPVEQIPGFADAVNVNPSILRGKSASEVIAWAHRKMGGRAASVAPSSAVDAGDTTAAILRDEALQLRQEAAEIQGVGRMEFTRFDPDDLTVDAGLMQFKAGGDADGVTDRLQGVETWNPMLAGRVVVWAADDGRMLIADGHQRMGLARRIKAADPGQRPMLDAIVLREADGFDAESVRVWAALKNIAEGTGTAIDAAKIMRGMGVDEAMKYVPPRSALVRDGAGLAALGDDAFGAVVNELVNPGHAAIVGRLASDPGEQKALIDLLIRLKPESMGQADSIVRQGKAAGFNTETQTDMFGSLDVTASLMIERARVLERGLGELKKLKQVFSTTARNADTLDAAGSRIDRERSAQEAIDNAQAIDIVNRLAFRSGPIGSALDDAARKLAAGGSIGNVVRDFVNDVRGIDIAAMVRSGEDAADGRIADAGGRPGDGAEADGPLPTERGYSDEPDGLDGGWPSLDEIEAAGQTGFDIFDAAPMRGFDAPAGEAARVQADSLAHDLRMVADEVDQQGMTFNIDGEERLFGDLLDEHASDLAAIEAARKCML